MSSSEEFVDECIRLDNLPAVPPYWKRMRAQNMAGPALLGVLGEPPALSPDEFEAMASDGAVIVDARSPEAFGAAHIPGALNVGLGPSFSTWAGTVIEEGATAILVLDRPDELWDAAWQLLRIGYGPPAGWLSGGMARWRVQGKPLALLPQVTVHDLQELLAADEVNLLDVRQPAEWTDGHVAEAQFITGAELPERWQEVPADRPVAVTCGSGFRSSVSAAFLMRQGVDRVVNVTGGMSAWRAAGYHLSGE